jgi:hypothetical protein
MYGGGGGWHESKATRILNFDTRWEWSGSRPGLFIVGGVLGACWIGGWVGSRTGLDAVAKRTIFVPSELRSSNA